MYEEIYKKINKVSIVTVLVFVFMFGLGGIIAVRAVTPPDRGLGLADSYSVFGKAGITTTGVTNVWGNAGADSSVGLDDATQVDGSVYTGAGVAGVETDARSTYDSLMSALQGTPAGAVTGLNLAGTHTTLNSNPITPGVYNIAASTMDGAVELSGDGVYIFRSTSSVTSATSAARMTLTNGACASKVFWAIPASMTIGTYAHIEGTIIASTGAITIATGATLVGRAISLISQVTLDANQITVPTCAAPSADLSLIKTVNDATPDVGDTIIYTVTITNDGPDATTGVIVEDLLTGGLSWVSDDSLGTYNWGSGVWTVGAIANGASKTLTITATVNTGTGGDTITNTAEITASDEADADSTPDNHIITEDDQDSVDVVLNTPPPEPSTLVLNKIVDNTGSVIVKTSNDFQAKIDGVNVPWVTPQTLTTGVQYTASEVSLSNYTASDWGGGCASDGTITLIPGVNTCTITNTYIPPVVLHSSSGSSVMPVVPVFEPTITILSTPVVVAPILPILPKTGFPPQEKSNLWNILIGAGVLMLVSASLVLILKKSKI